MQATHLKKSFSDKAFIVLNYVLLALALLIVLIPLLHVVAQSISAPTEVVAGRVFIIPKKPTLIAYKEIFRSKLLLSGYGNSILYTVVGTLVNILMTILCAYPLSRKDFIGRKWMMWLFVFTMIFSAPLIPTYLNVRNLKLIDTMWAVILPGAIGVYNMVVARTFFMNTIPDEMIEAEELDGANDLQIVRLIVLPL